MSTLAGPRLEETKTGKIVENEAGRAVMAMAKSYIGTVESPALSNHGTVVDEFQALCGIASGGQAWCACFATSMYIKAKVDDENLGDPNVKTILQRAAAKNRLSKDAAVGCFACFGERNSSGDFTAGHHVGLFLRWHDYSKRQMVIIDGNHPLVGGANDGVRARVVNFYRPIPSNANAETFFVVPRPIVLSKKKPNR